MKVISEIFVLAFIACVIIIAIIYIFPFLLYGKRK
jgi:hypothetical protein